MYFLGKRQGYDGEQLKKIMDRSLRPTGQILLVITGGGIIRWVLQDCGMGDIIGPALAKSGLPLVLVAFLIAALIRASVGAAVVAMTMAAGIMAAMPGVAGLSPVYLAAMVCAINGGATAFSHVNDSGFWLVSSFLPEVYAKIYKILQSNSYIAFKLTGAVTQDVSQGYGLHCFNMKKGCWDEKMCKRLGIPMEFLPEICDCDHVVGTVTGKAAAECGLVEGTPVVAGGLDAACGTLGAGVIHSGETQEQGGQAGGMSICTEEYKADPRLILSYHVVPGKWLLQGGTTGGGGVMRWFEREFADYERMMKEQTGVSSLDQLNKIAEKVAPGCDGMVFLPYMSGERSPIWNPYAKGVFYGLDFAKTKGHMVRACMEGVALSLRHNLEVAKEAGAEADVLRAMGGSANSLLWTQIKSDITGKPIIVPASDTATTLGAALLAGVGVGFYKDYEEAVSLTVKETRRHEPDPKNKAVYDKTFETYMELYKSLAHIMTAK